MVYFQDDEGTPEEFIQFLMEFEEEIVRNYPVTNYVQCTRLFKQVLAGHAKDSFTTGYKSIENQEGNVSEKKKFEGGLTALRLQVFGANKNAYRRQRN